MKPIITAKEHYDRLADRGDGRNDPPLVQTYMARWDGPQFYDMLGDLTGKDVLEVGIGVGRIARTVLKKGCRRLTGMDISAKALAAAAADLAEFRNLELVLADVADFRRDDSFDVVFSVLTFMHVENKPKALQNVVAAVRTGGHVVLSIDETSDCLDYGEWSVRLSPWRPDQYADALAQIGCQVAPMVPLIDTWTSPAGRKSDTYGAQVATLIKATKPCGLSNNGAHGRLASSPP